MAGPESVKRSFGQIVYLKQLQTFLAIAECGSATKAAQVLRIRLTPEELEQVDFSAARKHNQRQLQSLVPDLG